ncbi:MAG: hypothetical protein HC927_07405 [Deltaproteobacteria bacterium]|nr:hypothetical protein [Deltaproteobacteria bacterium]
MIYITNDMPAMRHERIFHPSVMAGIVLQLMTEGAKLPTMTIDLRGRVKNARLPTSRPLLPLFESVVNSLQSLDDSQPKNPFIRIEIDRAAQASLALDSDALSPPETFHVYDNGTGFNDQNFQSFCTSDSTFKEAIGGKGVGRFMWLKAFEKVRIESVFRKDKKKFAKRSFLFTINDGGIDNHRLELSPGPANTIVHLIGMRTRWQKNCPKRVETIAYQLIQHIISWYIYGKAPSIVITDGQDTYDLATIWEETYRSNVHETKIDVSGNLFMLHHLRLYNFLASQDEHSVHFCAHGREVFHKKIVEMIPPLPNLLTDEQGDRFLWKTFASGSYFDENVTSDRTGFDIPDDSATLFGDSEISFQHI